MSRGPFSPHERVSGTRGLAWLLANQRAESLRLAKDVGKLQSLLSETSRTLRDVANPRSEGRPQRRLFLIFNMASFVIWPNSDGSSEIIFAWTSRYSKFSALASDSGRWFSLFESKASSVRFWRWSPMCSGSALRRL